MIAPLLPYALRGVIWYQGESNADAPELYRERFVALLRDWRQRFAPPGAKPEELGFYWVQLASFIASQSWAALREAQAQALSEPHTGMAVTLDIGDPHDIHPRNKREVGRRLALSALEGTYGKSPGFSRGPSQGQVKAAGDDPSALVVHFDSAGSLSTCDGASTVLGFELAGSDALFHPATASIEGAVVRVRCDLVPVPQQLRYAFSDCPEVNLVNQAGLPAEPFRWPVPKA
jgi:sialate O-acetylesterase